MSEKILLIDGHSILNRAFYGLPADNSLQMQKDFIQMLFMAF